MTTLPGALLLAAAVAAGAAAPPDSADRIRAAVRDAWTDAAGPDAEIEVREVPVFPAPFDDAELDVAPPALPVDAGVRGVPVSLRRDGRVVARGLATVHVRRFVPVWVVSRAVLRDATLGPDDVRRERRLFDREPAREVRGELEPGRWSARRALEPGDVLRTGDVVRRPDVAAGAGIRLVARAGAAEVAIAAVARRSGDVGDVIQVLNPLTGALVDAVVVDAGTAELAQGARRRGAARTPGGNAP